MFAESVVEIEGAVVASSQAPGGFELHDPAITVLGAPAEAPPFELRRPALNSQLPTLLDHAAVSLRHPKIRAAFSISAASLHGFRSTLDALGFTEIQTPKIVGAATESGANVFGLDYFGRRAYLAQSPQLYKQMMVGVFERVYETGPVFRAEPHDTVRHLAEYVSLDAELGFIRDHRDVEAVLRSVIAGMVASIEARAEPARSRCSASTFRASPTRSRASTSTTHRCSSRPRPARPSWASPTSPRRTNAGWASTRSPSTTRSSSSWRATRWRSDRSTRIRSRAATSSRTASTSCSGASSSSPAANACTSYGDYLAVLDEPARGALAGYLEAFRHGMPPHGGFAIGLERWVARVVGAANIREVTLFPRDLNRLSP